MILFQKELTLKPYSRGYHIITDCVLEAIPELKEIQRGFMQVFIKQLK